MGITTDNASNNTTFIDSLILWSNDKAISFDKNQHFRCFAHIINLSVQVALKYFEKEISQVSLFNINILLNFITNKLFIKLYYSFKNFLLKSVPFLYNVKN